MFKVNLAVDVFKYAFTSHFFFKMPTRSKEYVTLKPGIWFDFADGLCITMNIPLSLYVSKVFPAHPSCPFPGG